MVGTWKYNAWVKAKGMSKEAAVDQAIPIMHEIFREYGFGSIIADPNRPGPNYYKDCKKYNWIEHLVDKHKSHLKLTGKSVKLYQNEELYNKGLEKLKQNLQYAFVEK